MVINTKISKRLVKKILSLGLFLLVGLNIFATNGVATLNRSTKTTNYVNGNYVEYTLELKNTTSTKQENLTLKDTFFNSSGIEDISIEVLESKGEGTSIDVSGALTEGSDLEISGITLGYTPEVTDDRSVTTAEENGYIKLKIKGKIKDAFTDNIVSYGELSNDSGVLYKTADSTLTPASSNVSITKSTTNIGNYLPGDEIEYNITVTNSGEGYAYGYNLLDDLSEVKTALANDSTGSIADSSDITSGSAFDSGTITLVSKGSNSGSKYTVGTSQNSLSLDDNIYIAPGESLTYNIKRTTNKSAIGEIENVATISNGTDTKTSETIKVSPEELNTSDVTIEKTVAVTEYEPGQDVTYTITVKNNDSDKFVNNYNITDNISDILTTQADGTNGQAFSSWTLNVVSPTTSNDGTKVGTAISGTSTTSDIDINVDMAPGEEITYELVAKVSDTSVGTILDNSASNNVVESGNGIKSKSPNVSITKTTTNKEKYLPGNEIEYNITVTNSGEGYAYGYNLLDDLSAVNTTLANDSTGSIADSSDITSGSAFDSGTITLISKGSNSGSKYTVGNSQSSLSLDDNIYIAPGESLTYNIKGITNKSAIGEIENVATISNGTDDKTSETIKVSPEELNTSDVTIEKTVSVTEYEPGQDVTYTITVKNNDSDKFVNNYNITDNISDILTTQADGTQGPAFSSWTLNVVSPTSSNDGTKVGTTISGTSTTSDIDINVDMAPGEEITYELVAKVSDTSVGTILDGSASDNVVESGNGIKSYPSQLAISKTVNETEYSPNSILTYQIIIENKGNGYDTDVKVKDLLSSIMDEEGNGSNNAFKSWSITSEFESLDAATGGTPSGDSGITSESLVDTDLDVIAQIGARTKLVYTIKATVSGTVFGKIVNTASIDDKLYSDKGCFPIDPDITTTLTSDYPSYPKSTDDLSNSFDITYTLTVSNDENAGFAKDVQITDLLSDISTTALNGDEISNLFESFNIIATTSDDDTKITSGGTYTSGINDTVDITAGGNVKYTITAKVKRDPSNNIIPYEEIVNTATVTPKDKDGNDMSTINLSSTTSKELPALKITKSTSNMTYLPGGEITYFLTIENTGEGYANNAIVSDTLSTNFSSWTIKKIVPDTFIGTNADVNGDVLDNNDISATADIAPGETVQYKIVGIAKSDLTNNFILNVGTVEDTQRGNLYESSVKLMEITDLGFYITKEAEEYSYAPGGEINYTVTLYNTTSEVLNFGDLDYKFIDKFSEIDTNLANDKGGTTTDTTGSPFKKLFVSVNDGTEVEITDVNSDYEDEPTLSPGVVESGNLITPKAYTYKFRGVLKDNILSDEIKNEAVVEDSSGAEMVIASHEIDGSNSGSYTRKVSESKYTPGDEITYTFIATGVDGYLNDYHVNEDIKNIQVELLDGTTGNPFSTGTGDPQFTVKRYINDVLDDDPNSSGTVTSSVSDNENIDQIIDVSPEDIVRYEATGVIRQDIAGTINFNGLVTEPYRHNLVTTTTVEEGDYVAGEEITLKTTIGNNSNGNASNISIKDIISDLKVDLSNGTTGDLFPDGWTITTETLGDNGDLIEVGTYLDSNDLSTEICIPVNSTLIYKITGVVNELAVGTAINKVIVDGDTVSTDISSLSDNLTVTKEIDSYYKSDKITTVTGGYVPDGWIKYKISINNIGSGIANDIVISDALSNIKTTAYKDDGTTEEIAAFSEWEILSYEKTGNENQSVINLNSGTEALGSTSLEWEMDIPSKGSIAVYVLAHVSEGAIGDIKNTVTVDGKDYSSETSESLEGKAVLTKKAYESDGVTAKSKYAPGDTVIYKVSVENTGDGIISGTIKDEISKITSSIEEDGTNGTTPEGFSFSNFTVTASKSNSGTDNITKIGSFESELTKTDVDINDVLIIAPGATVTFEIKGTIKANVIGNVKNTAEFENESKSVTLKEKSSNISVEKKVIKVGDTSISDGTDPINYNPGDTIEYLITITNTGYGHKNNLRLTENIDEITSEIAGSESTSTAFESYTFEILDSGDSYIRKYGLITVMDMAPGKENDPEVVTIKVTGKLKDNVIGEIAENIVTYNNTTAESEKLEPYDPKITYYKSFTDSSKNEISEKEYFSPEETLYYKLVVENTGDGYANDLKIIDKIYDLATSYNDKAFEDGEVTVTTKIYNGTSITNGTDDGKTYIMGDISGSSLINSTVDIAPNSTVEFYISGKTTAYALGTITNKVTVTGDGNPTIETGKTDNVTTESKPSNIVGDKIAGIDSSVSDVSYTPDGDISYKLTFDNTGEGPGIVYIEDIVSNIKVAGPGGNEVDAFQSGYKFVLKTESGTVYYPSDSTSAISSSKTISGDLDTSIKLGGNSSCSFILTGKASIQAVEAIKNTATYKINSETATGTNISATINPTPGEVEITNTADVANYTPGEQVTYTLTIKNTGDGYAQNVNVEDLLSTMTGETSGGGDGLVFNSIDNVIVTHGTNSASIGTGTTTNGYEGDFDIAPGESIVIKLTGTVNDNILGEIKNDPIVTYDGNPLKAPVILETVLPELDIVTKISIDGSSYSQNPTNYIPGEKLYYEVTLSNIGEGWDDNVNLTNVINEITALSSDGTSQLVFDESTIIIALESGDNVTFDSSAHNLDATMDIAPGENIIFKIEGVVNDNIIGEIKLDSKYKDSNGTTSSKTSNEVLATQKNEELSVKERIKNPDTGIFDLDESSYIPGEDVVFKIFIENSEDTFAQNIDINNYLKSMKVELADGSDGVAFSSWTIEESDTPTNENSLITNTIESGNNLNSTGNLAPKDKYSFIVTAKVNENAVGEIENRSTYTLNSGSENYSNTIKFTPEENVIEITKTADSTTYYPNGEMVYNVVIENTGNSIINDISFEDDVNKEQVLLADGNNGDQFDSTTVTGEVVAGDTTLTGSVPTISVDNTTGKVTSDTLFDIKAGEKITFQIKVTVNENVVGQIKNTANYTLNGTTTDSNEIITEPEDNKIEITKTAESTTYYPNGEMVYNVVIENTGNSIINDISFVDDVNKEQVLLADGNNGDPFNSAIVTGEVVTGDTTLTGSNPTISADNTTGKVTSTTFDIKKGEKITFQIKVTVNENVVGQIKNTANYTLDGTTTDSNEIITEPEANSIEITKTAESTTYYPNGEMVYNVVIENTGNSIINDISFVDDVNKEQVLLADGNNGDPFDNSTVTGEVVTGDTTLTGSNPTISTNTTGKITSTTFDIKKGEKITFQIKGTVNENVVGDIKNTANYTLDGATTDSNEVTTDPEDNKIEITKTAESATYYPNGEMVYNVVIENTGNSIINDISFEDDVNKEQVLLADGNNGDPFDSSTVTGEVVTGDTTLTGSNPTISADNTTGKVTSTTFDIKKGEKITFQIKGTVNENVVGQIKNTANYTLDGTTTDSNEIITEPEANSIEITKTAESTTYYPNGEMVYNVVIENTGNSIINDISFEDDVNKEQVLLADGTDGDPFDSSTVTGEVVSGETTITTTHPNVSVNAIGKVTSTTFDIKKGEKITFQIKGTVNENVVGQIKNTANYTLDGTTTDSNEIITEPEANSIEITKTAESTTYYPNGEMVYNVVIENTGNSIINDISFEDDVNKEQVLLADGTDGDPFDSTTVTGEV
ncbi:DUF11 domain-containing protein, partial [Fusobacterium sp. IOR10]|uniref:DUF11 domain-containing protein n=1 Tax=Fusobacterium sp. IOR10 TaxID=2665157 RepID=UPI0013D58E13